MKPPRSRSAKVPAPLRLGKSTLDFERTRILGALNATPDSFSDGGLFLAVDSAVARARQMLAEGADIVDIGGESTRPGANPVSAQEEMDRVLPVIERLAGEMPISIDTQKPSVARAAVGAGAVLINDISGLGTEMLEVAAELRVPAIAMHMQGDPGTMQARPHYSDVVAEVAAFLERRLEEAEAAGVQTILDPGIGFGKTVEHNLVLLRHLDRLVELGAPVLVGASRKSFLGKVCEAEVGDRLHASVGAHLAAVASGAHLIRVHDVEAHRQACDVFDRVRGGRPSRDQRGDFAPTALETTSSKVSGIRCSAHVGVTAAERRDPQELIVDVEVNGAAPCRDQIDDAVDYSEVARITREVVESCERQLIETVAAAVGQALIHHLAADRVRVEISKPGAAAELEVERILVEWHSERR